MTDERLCIVCSTPTPWEDEDGQRYCADHAHLFHPQGSAPTIPHERS